MSCIPCLATIRQLGHSFVSVHFHKADNIWLTWSIMCGLDVASLSCAHWQCSRPAQASLGRPRRRALAPLARLTDVDDVVIGTGTIEAVASLALGLSGAKAASGSKEEGAGLRDMRFSAAQLQAVMSALLRARTREQRLRLPGMQARPSPDALWRPSCFAPHRTMPNQHPAGT